MAVGKAALGKVEDITRAILVLRGRRVLLGAELAVLYGVTTRRLNEQVRRNRKRFRTTFYSSSQLRSLRT
jgi:ORF6N domain